MREESGFQTLNMFQSAYTNCGVYIWYFVITSVPFLFKIGPKQQTL
jgi:hypothetical protein